MPSRIRNALAVYAYALLGIFLVVAPWTAVWDQAVRGLLPEALGSWMAGGWVRGVISALGALDLLTAVRFGVELWGGGADPDRTP